MAHALIACYRLFDPVGPSEYRFNATRLSIFLICEVCLGLPALVWAAVVLHRRYKSKSRISAFVIVVLLNDAVELLLDLYIIAKLLQGDGCGTEDTTCHIFSLLWSTLLICGVHLQQMMVLESILSLNHPFCSAHVFFPSCSLLISIFAFIFVFLCESLQCVFFTAPVFLLLSLLPLLAVTVTSWIIICRTPPTKTHSSDRTKKPEYAVLAFATFTMTVYVIFLVLHIFWRIWSIWMLWMTTVCLLSLRVITDPLLCVVVCREKITQTHTDPKTDQTSVQAEQSL